MNPSEKTNYPNLYDILDNVHGEVEKEQEAIKLEEERQKQRMPIQVAENSLYTKAGVTFLPDIEEFLDLLARKLSVTRLASDSSISLDASPPASNPEFQDASAPPSECGDDDFVHRSSGSESESGSRFGPGAWVGDDYHSQEEIRKARREVRQNRIEIDNLKQSSSPQIISMLPLMQPASPQPIVINNNNSNNSNNNTGKYQKEEKERSGSKKSDAKSDAKNEADDTLKRIMIGLGALAVGAWGVYELAKSTGEDVSDAEIDEAAKKTEKLLATLCTINGRGVLKLSETYQNLSRTLALWHTYRSRTYKHKSNLNFYKKLVWIPLLASGASRALLPGMWHGPLGEGLGLGVGVVLGYGALRWVYESTYYYFGYTSKDKWDQNEIKKLLKQL